jgi:cobalt-zinc-cadmium efflux system membrane fusion protein
VLPQDYAQASTYIGGVVKSILVQEGTFVKKGETVLTLEHPELVKLQQEYITSKNHIIFLEKEYNRQQQLFDNNAGKGKAFEEAEANYKAEKGVVLSLKNQLSMLSISTDALDNGRITRTIALKAPIKGYVGNLNISLGAYAEPNKLLFDVTNISNLIVKLNIFEKDVTKIKEGQKLVLDLPNQGLENIEGEIFSIAKNVDKKTKTVSIRATINDENSVLIPGMFVNALIAVSGKKSKIIPEDAVIRTGEKQYVFIATDEWCSNPNLISSAPKVNIPKTEMTQDSISLSYEMIEVQTNSTIDGYTGITANKDISDYVVVTEGAYYLMSQLKSGDTVGCCAVPEEIPTE